MSDELPERQLGERSTFAQEMRDYGSAAMRIPSKERSAWLRSLSPRERLELREAGEVDALELAHADREARLRDLGTDEKYYEDFLELFDLPPLPRDSLPTTTPDYGSEG